MIASRAWAPAPSRATLRAASAAGLLSGFLLVPGPGAAQTPTASAAPSEPASAVAADLEALTSRVEDLERRLGASALLELMTRIERLTNEIKEMRDRTEMQARSLDALQGRQQDLYAELDRLARRIAMPVPPDDLGVLPGATGEIREAVPSGPDSPEGSGHSGVRDEDAAADTLRAPDSTGGPPGGADSHRESPSPYDPVEEQAHYQRAFDLLSEGRFERAAAAFEAFLGAFPESRYRDDATFWQGECLYALRQFGPALEKFRVLVETHAESSRVPGAKLKIGFILHELGQPAEAAQILRELVNTAPDSSEAKLARDRLARLE